MDMGVGFTEILLILLLVLIFFGSKELPKFVRESARLFASRPSPRFSCRSTREPSSRLLSLRWKARMRSVPISRWTHWTVAGFAIGLTQTGFGTVSARSFAGRGAPFQSS